MDRTTLLTVAVIALGFAAAGIYLLLPRVGVPLAPRWRHSSGTLTAIAVLLYVLIVGRMLLAVDDDSRNAGGTIATLLLAVVALSTAGMTIVSKRATWSVAAFVLLHISNAGLYALTGAWRGAGAILAFGVFFGGLAWWKGRGDDAIPATIGTLSSAKRNRSGDGGESPEREPLLACCAGLILSLSLFFVFASQPQLLRVAMFGVLVFAAGGIGFVSRAGVSTIALSWGVMVQGVLMTLVGFCAVHGTPSGDRLAMMVVAITGIEGAAALALIRLYGWQPAVVMTDAFAETSTTPAKEGHE